MKRVYEAFRDHPSLKCQVVKDETKLRVEVAKGGTFRNVWVPIQDDPKGGEIIEIQQKVVKDGGEVWIGLECV